MQPPHAPHVRPPGLFYLEPGPSPAGAPPHLTRQQRTAVQCSFPLDTATLNGDRKIIPKMSAPPPPPFTRITHPPSLSSLTHHWAAASFPPPAPSTPAQPQTVKPGRRSDLFVSRGMPPGRKEGREGGRAPGRGTLSPVNSPA